jgi:hypothetical protein
LRYWLALEVLLPLRARDSPLLYRSLGREHSELVVL